MAKMTLLRLSTAVILVLLLGSCHRGKPAPEVEPYATRDGSTIALHPSNITFRVPQQWLEWDDQFHNNFHLSRTELQKVEDATGEWDREYAAVVNSALPFKDCAVHVGGDGWGKEGTSFADVQMRAYVTVLSEQELLSRIQGPALSSARLVSHASPSSKSLGALAPSVEIQQDVVGEWHRAVIRYPLWYGDYGGTARVRFYLALIGSHTLALVFMGGDDHEVETIVNSVFIPRRSG